MSELEIDNQLLEVDTVSAEARLCTPATGGAITSISRTLRRPPFNSERFEIQMSEGTTEWTGEDLMVLIVFTPTSGQKIRLIPHNTIVELRAER